MYFSYNILHSKGVEFSLDGGTTVFITTDPININDISIDPSGDGLLCQSEIEIPDPPGGRHWYINPEMESTAIEDRIVNDGDNRGWVRTRVGLSNNIRQVIMRRERRPLVLWREYSLVKWNLTSIQ